MASPMSPSPTNSCSRPPTASRSSAWAWSRREPEPSGGVASRTVPAAFAGAFPVEPLAVSFLAVAFLLVTPLLAEVAPVAPLAVEFRDAVERFLDADVRLAADDRFLDAPQVDMTSYTVPIVGHTRP